MGQLLTFTLLTPERVRPLVDHYRKRGESTAVGEAQISEVELSV
jgi:hypothetical protein